MQAHQHAAATSQQDPVTDRPRRPGAATARPARRHGVLAGLALLLAAGSAGAQGTDLKALRDFPTKPVELMVAYAVGGGMDIHARVVAKYLQKHTGQNFIVVNRVGAGGLVGHRHIATTAAADGYTVGIMSTNFVNDALLRSEGKWTLTDVRPLAAVNAEGVAWVTGTQGRFKNSSLADIVAMARDNPGTISVGAGVENNFPTDNTGFLLRAVEQATKVRFNPIPYQSGRQSATDAAAGNLDVGFAYAGEYQGLLSAGRIRILALSTRQRVASAPDVPTFNEQLPGADVVWDTLRFAVVPKAIDAARAAWLQTALQTALADPQADREFEAQGARPQRELNAPGRLEAELQRRTTEVGRLVKLLTAK